MDFIDLVGDFAKRVGLETLVPDDEGCVYVQFDEMVVCFSEVPDSASVAIYAPVGMLPPQTNAQLLTLLMRANYLGRGTGGATLSQIDNGNTILLHQVVPLVVLDGETFANMVEKFVNVVEEWHANLLDFRPIGEALERKEAEDAVARQLMEKGENGFIRA